MEMANLNLRLREATSDDLPALAQLLHSSPYSHVHVDWRLPRYWIKTPGFYLAESTIGSGELQACLAIGADPPPGAWVRVAAAKDESTAAKALKGMLGAIIPFLRQRDVRVIGWLPRSGWPAPMIKELGFDQVDEVVTYVKRDLEIPADVGHNDNVIVRGVRSDDLPLLAAMEEAAFEPLWRHSADSLALGWRRALSFHVATLNGEVAGFQYSADSDVNDAGHLVRLTVSPTAQRSGVGSALLREALLSYRARRLRGASLNTQASNKPSRKLYEKFDYQLAGYRWPVWSLRLPEDSD